MADAESLLAVLEDARGVLAGTSAARQLGWQVPDGDCPVELHVPEAGLVDVIEAYALEMASDEPVDVVLRAVPDPWPFPPHVRVMPEIVAALDLVSRSPLLSPSSARSFSCPLPPRHGTIAPSKMPGVSSRCSS